MRQRRSRPRLTGLAALLIAAGGCTSVTSSTTGSSGGILGPGASNHRPGVIEVHAYALAPGNRVPPNAIGYAVPVFTDKAQAARYCPGFLSKLTFHGSLTTRTPLRVQSYGRTVQIAPFVWPVTSWSQSDRPSCNLLVQRYNISGARTFLQLAQEAIKANGGNPPDALEGGPFIVTVRRVSGSVMVYDLSRAPTNDYGRWLSKTVQQLSNPASRTAMVVRPPMRDQVRAFVFGTIPTWSGILDVLIPGFMREQDRS